METFSKVRFRDALMEMLRALPYRALDNLERKFKNPCPGHLNDTDMAYASNGRWSLSAGIGKIKYHNFSHGGGWYAEIPCTFYEAGSSWPTQFDTTFTLQFYLYRGQLLHTSDLIHKLHKDTRYLEITSCNQEEKRKEILYKARNYERAIANLLKLEVLWQD